MRLIVVFLMLCWGFAPDYGCQMDEADHALEPYIERLLIAESNNEHFRGRYVIQSHKGAIGRWQVMPDNADWFTRHNSLDVTVADLFDERTNAIVGYWYLRYCYMRARGNIAMAISFYNMGHNSGRVNYSYLQKICPELME
jgi:hypothetical protein